MVSLVYKFMKNVCMNFSISVIGGTRERRIMEKAEWRGQRPTLVPPLTALTHTQAVEFRSDVLRPLHANTILYVLKKPDLKLSLEILYFSMNNYRVWQFGRNVLLVWRLNNNKLQTSIFDPGWKLTFILSLEQFYFSQSSCVSTWPAERLSLIDF